MEDTWLSVEDDSNSSSADSDAIDSETEAELYSIIHYEQNLQNVNCLENAHTSDETKNIYLTEKSTEFNESRLVNTFNHETVFLNKESQKLNSVKKDKSGSSDKCNVSCSSQNSEDIYVNQTVKDTLSNKRKSDCVSSVSSNSVKKNFTGLNDSSDSDSIIWTEVDTSEGKKFQTNLCEEDLVYLSSESESHSDDLPLSKRSEGNLRNMSMPNIKIGETTKDVLWFVNEKDVRRAKQSKTRRYHDNAENTCSNCLGKGHNYRICPLPKIIKCYICGDVGHPGAVCINRMCGKCFSAGHDSRQCRRPSFRYCVLCSMKGHVKENCPDLWRRYHLTTRPGKIVWEENPMSTPGSFLYCWNCGEGGHVGAVCRESRGLKFYLSTWPCVVSYADPENLLKERLNSNRERYNNFRRENNFNQINKAVGASMFVVKSEQNNNGEICNNFRRENHLNQINKAVRASVLAMKTEENNNGERCDNFRTENHLNQMNAAVGANVSSEKKKKKKKKKTVGASMFVVKSEQNNNGEICNNFRRENHLNQINKAVRASVLVMKTEENNNGERCDNFRTENHLNQMNAAVGADVSSEKKKKNKAKQRLKWQWKQFKKAQREKDFPRTPKNNESNCINDSVPESRKKVLIKRQQRKERKRRRKINRLLQRFAEKNGSKNSLQTV